MKLNSEKKSIYIKLAIFAFALILLLLFKDFGLSLNRNVENTFYNLRGEIKPDSNIVIIHITKNDFENLGSWPLKRSYYALLINQLTKYKAKVIGLNIFLSDRISSQSVYNELLNSEIQNSGKVVLTSIVSSFDENNFSGNLLLPEAKKYVENVETGHSNYFDKNGIIIPIQFNSAIGEERAFAFAIAEKANMQVSVPSLMKVNFLSSWRSFKTFSLLEFFNLVENNEAANLVKDKFVIIGISDPQISGIIKTAFDDELPGVAIQAFALDNIIQHRFIITKYWKLSSIFFGLLILFLIFSNIKTFPKFILIFAIFFILSFIFFSFLNIQLQFYIFILPFTFLLIYEMSVFILYKIKRAEQFEGEAAILRKDLALKESELQILQNEFSLLGEKSSSDILLKINKLKSEIQELKIKQKDETPIDKGQTEENNFYGIIYQSKIMNSIVELVKKVGAQDATILILGESGTGKELIARAVHQLNEKRKNNNFIAVNCAALSETLLESELFGHTKGAFTNAVNDKSGRFEAADKGTIFLDEIGETSENFQAKLLRVLQSGEFEKVGSSKTVKTDARIVAATNKDLQKLVKEKKFREDLFYRLNVIKIELPTLRERKEDIEIIADHFAKKEDKNLTISEAVLEQLFNYDWPGNIRELESAIKRASIFAKAENRKVIKLSDLPEDILKKDKMYLENLILHSLREKNFSHSAITETAKELGNLNRTVISENFRGVVFKTYYENGFDFDKTVECVAQNDDSQVIEKVSSKINTFLRNIESDVKSLKEKDFESVKTKLNSKYKNLPQKFHSYLDAIIQHQLK